MNKKICFNCGKIKEDYESAYCDKCWEEEQKRLNTKKGGVNMEKQFLETIGGNNVFDIAKFNELITQGDLLGLEYLKPFIPSELEERYNNILTLNYVNNCCKQGKIEGNIFDIYTKNKEDFLRDMGLINIINGNGGEYMQNKIIKEENNNEEYL